ncbi:MAG: tagaturonate reductase [Clostridia bacterium]|nr:tagaturonate reductase [Clostridia bacterium]
MNQILQFGEGGFLRGFCDWMLQIVNEKTDSDFGVTVIQPLPTGLCRTLRENGCRYTHVCRGAEGVEEKEIRSIRKCVLPYDEFDDYLALASEPAYRFVISNTTEAGIAFDPTCRLEDRPAKSFPGKLTQLLYRRYKAALSGFIFLPCELIDRNGDRLKECILRYADHWELEEGFREWIERENVFCCTLVDRINTGCPDPKTPLLNTSEYFHLWVIEGYPALFHEIPFDRCGLNVILTEDLERYRTRKVRMLNGAHTASVLYGLLEGLETVEDMIRNETLNAHLRACLFDEIIPTLDLPREEAVSYAESVLVRFSNPHIRHLLSAISLNSVSKFRVRVLPSILEYRRRFGHLPPHLTLSFAKLIEFYRTPQVKDDKDVADFMKRATVGEILANTALWGEDLSFMKEEVERFVDPSLR